MNQRSWENSDVFKSIARRSIGRKLLASIGPRFITYSIHDFQLLLDLKDQWGVSKYILKHGVYDKDLCFVVDQIVKKGARCVDIGANIGFWTMFLLNKIQAKNVVAVEPEPRNFSLLKSNIGLNKLSNRVQLHNCALGSEKSQLRLYLSQDNSGDHQLYSSEENRQSINVAVERLDDLLGDQPVDFIKMDIQGYEPFAIDGMQRVLENNQDLIILSEWWPAAIMRTGRDPNQTLKALSNLGFHLHLIDERNKVFRNVGLDSLENHIKGDHHVDLIISRKLFSPMSLS